MIGKVKVIVWAFEVNNCFEWKEVLGAEQEPAWTVIVEVVEEEVNCKSLDQSVRVRVHYICKEKS